MNKKVIALYQNYVVRFFSLWRHFGFKIAANEVCFVLNRKVHRKSYGDDIATIRKYMDIIAWLSKKYSWVIHEMDQPHDFNTWCGENIDEKCPIFFWWEQGIENAPEVVKLCLQSIVKNSGSHEVVFLDKNTLRDYIQLPDYVLEKHDCGIISSAFLSDVIRFCLLEKYGGIWVDACDFALNGKAFQACEGRPFYSARGFTVEMNITRHLWSDSFFACGKNNMFARLMKALLLEYCKDEDCTIDYFVSSCFENVLYNEIENLREMFISYPINNKNFYSLRLILNDTFDQAVFDKYTSDTDILNLTWKNTYNNSESYFEFLKKL